MGARTCLPFMPYMGSQAWHLCKGLPVAADRTLSQRVPERSLQQLVQVLGSRVRLGD